jgi:predicted ribosome quality control (RQC) complex YloA/Tae2 family protein
MSFKALNTCEIELLLQELKLEDNYIQQIKLNDSNELLLECYGKEGSFKLVLAINPNTPLFYKIDTASSQNKNSKLHPFVDQLKKWLKGGKIVEINQPGLQRVVMFRVKHWGEDFYLLFKMWSKKVNLYLCNGQFEVMGSFYKDGLVHWTFPVGKIVATVRQFEVREGLSNQFVIQNVKEEQNFQKQRAIEQQKIKQRQLFEAKKRALKQTLLHNKNFEQSRQIAILLQSQKHCITKGMDRVILTNYEDDSQIEVKIDPKLSATDNANHYFKQYHKQHSAFLYASRQLEELELPFKELDIVSQETKRVKIDKHKKIGLTLTVENCTLLVGRNASENDELLRYYTKGLDWFFHIKGFSGGYVIVKGCGKTEPSSTVKLKACALATQYSKAKNQKEVEVSYTQIKYVKRLKVTPYNGLKKGAVSLSYAKTMHYIVTSG